MEITSPPSKKKKNKKQIHTKVKDFSTSIALLGATRITLTRFPLNNPFHPSVFMILLKTSVVECPLLPTIKCVLIVSNGATAVRDTAPAIAPLINLLNEGFATLTFNFRPTFPLLELPSSAASGIPKILNPSGEDTYFTYRSIHGSFKPALLLSREFGEFGEIPNPIPTWPTLANRPPGWKAPSWRPHWSPKSQLGKTPFLLSSSTCNPLLPMTQNLVIKLFRNDLMDTHIQSLHNFREKIRFRPDGYQKRKTN